jgi:hypothetical protein
MSSAARRLSSPRLLAPLLAFAALPGLACSGGDSNAEACAPSAASLEIGWLDSGSFSAFESGNAIAVVHGVQGGTWVMPAIRFSGVTSGGSLSGTMTLDSGVLLGESHRPNVRLVNAADGSALLQSFPVPVGTAAGSPDVSEVNGANALFVVTYEDSACGQVELALPVVLDVRPP